MVLVAPVFFIVGIGVSLAVVIAVIANEIRISCNEGKKTKVRKHSDLDDREIFISKYGPLL